MRLTDDANSPEIVVCDDATVITVLNKLMDAQVVLNDATVKFNEVNMEWAKVAGARQASFTVSR